MNILRHSVAKSRHSFTSRAGLIVPATLPGRLAAAGRQEPAVTGHPAEGSRRVLEAALQGRDWVTLDIDASVVHAKKKTARPAFQPRPARGNALADAYLPAALIPRFFRTRQGPAGNGHGFARPEFAMRPGTCPATAFRHGKRRCHAPHPALLTSPEHSGPASERIPACSGQKNFYLWIRGFTTS